MPSQPPLPPLLTSYLSTQPDASLSLISSILGATSNWLVLRYLYAALSASPSSNASLDLNEPQNGTKKKVILVSFLRGWEFWRAEAKRLACLLSFIHLCFHHVDLNQGLDLSRLAQKQQFAFLDGLSELFTSPQANAAPRTSPNMTSTPRTTLPLRSQPGAVPGRAPATMPAGQGCSSPRDQTEPGVAKKLRFSGRGTAALDALEKDIVSVIQQYKTSGDEDDELLLILDQPDFLLAATGPTMGIGATEMAEWVTGLQQQVHATVLTLAADTPLIHNAWTSGNQMATPIETEHSAFVISLAHRARSVMQLRTLETGAARDVSGVLRISRGGGWGVTEDSLEEQELLYYIQRDGGVKVFGRGES